MEKQQTLGFVLIAAVLIVWLYVFSPTPEPTIPNQQDSTLVPDNSQNTPQQVEEPEIKRNMPVKTTQTKVESNVPEKIITVETDLSIFEFSSRGARIKRIFLKKYNTWYSVNASDSLPYYKKYVQLVNTTRDGGDLNLIFVTKDGQYINTKDLEFESDYRNYRINISDDQETILTFTYNFDKDKLLKKIYKLKGNDYLTDFTVELVNMQDYISSLRYDLEWSNGLAFNEENAVDEALFSNAAAYSGEEVVNLDASSDGDKIDKSLHGKIDWLGVKTKYFTILMAPVEPNSDGGADIKGEHITTPNYGPREFYSTSLQVPFSGMNYQKDSFQIYAGPIDYDILKSYNKGFESIFDFGSFMGLKFITRPISEYMLLPLFTFLHEFIPNYGFVIIIFSLIIKLALYPLTRKSYQAMRKTSLLQPKIAAIKAQYKDDQKRIQTETMNLYRKYGVNPAGGCMPMLLQMPILFALFTFFKVTIQIRQEPFILWMTNLSSPDVLVKLPFRIPIFGVSEISGLALMLGIAMFYQQKMTMKDPSQKAMVYMSPVLFTLLFMGFPSGLNLYYLMFNILSIAQQYYINHQKGAPADLTPVVNPKKKGSGFMSRMMEAAEKQAQSQKHSAKKKR